MQVLLIRDDVKAFIEVIMLLTIARGGKVARGVKRRSVRTQYNTRRHSVLFEIHHLRAFARFKQPFFTQFVYDGLHFIVIKTLARVRIESNIEFFINFIDFFKREFLEFIEQPDAFFVAVFDKFEVFSRFVVHFGIVFAFLMVLDVQAREFFHAALFDFFRATPTLIRVDEFAELSAVVAEMVYADRVIA